MAERIEIPVLSNHYNWEVVAGGPVSVVILTGGLFSCFREIARGTVMHSTGATADEMMDDIAGMAHIVWDGYRERVELAAKLRAKGVSVREI